MARSDYRRKRRRLNGSGHSNRREGPRADRKMEFPGADEHTGELEATGSVRARVEAARRKRNETAESGLPVYAVPFSAEEIAEQARRPKRKVALLFSYSGSGYKGLQLSPHEKTIEGELFGALVAAGAISRANADDPKKIAFMRCARTDKGVHAAGNVLSLKLIIEDEDIVSKINQQLSSQIRVWNYLRTANAFNAHKQCDSRIYEYIIPTHCFLPPHPHSFLAKQLHEIADEQADAENYASRQTEVSDFWSEAHRNYIDPVLESLDPAVRDAARRLVFASADEGAPIVPEDLHPDIREPSLTPPARPMEDDSMRPTTASEEVGGPPIEQMEEPDTANGAEPSSEHPAEAQDVPDSPEIAEVPDIPGLRPAVRALKTAYYDAKRSYRIDQRRLNRVRSVLEGYAGTHRFHNFTVGFRPQDPKVQRHIKWFEINDTPFLTTDKDGKATEWISMRVHGQSFMMHQIRKMVSLATLIVRCGAPGELIEEACSPETKIPIPKAPGVGLLLERPIFDSYNVQMGQQNFQHTVAIDRRGSHRARSQSPVTKAGPSGRPAAKDAASADLPIRGPVTFEPYSEAILAFKQREIYSRIYREDAAGQIFHRFFAGLDGLRTRELLFLSSQGIAAMERDIPSVQHVNLRRQEPGAPLVQVKAKSQSQSQSQSQNEGQSQGDGEGEGIASIEKDDINTNVNPNTNVNVKDEDGDGDLARDTIDEAGVDG